VTASIIRDITGADDASMSNAAIIDQCVIPMVNEALAILEENKAQRPSDIDVVWLNGYGWPLDKGARAVFVILSRSRDTLSEADETPVHAGATGCDRYKGSSQCSLF